MRWSRPKYQPGIDLEESIVASEGWSREQMQELVEVPLSHAAIRGASIFMLLIGVVTIGRVVVLAQGRTETYDPRARLNLTESREIVAPRGIIYDRYGKILAENDATFFVFVRLKEFLRSSDVQTEALRALETVLGIPEDDARARIRAVDLDTSGDRVLIQSDVSQAQAVQLTSMNARALIIESGFERSYPETRAFGPVIGYTSLATLNDFKKNPDLSYQSIVGRTGIEAQYDSTLTGISGVARDFRNAKGEIIQSSATQDPQIGKSLTLTIDAGLQEYFHRRLQEGLQSLGRTVGAGLAIDPRTGEILALVNVPGFDNNVFVRQSRSSERAELLASSDRPLFNRLVSGLYNPGSTIKPLVSVAALSEGVATPSFSVYSPGYLDVPNPFDPTKPTRFLDWRAQGNVNAAQALAQSSNVYFYVVGGGFGETKGLGIKRLREWWHRFGLDEPTGIDLPNEAIGTLPDPDSYRERVGRPWLVGDTYNVSIGQGDLVTTPLALLNYITAIANGGTIYKPRLVRNEESPVVLHDLRSYVPAIAEAQKGMRLAVTSPLGTARTLADLPFAVGAKTGTAQVNFNTRENAFFVGYAPYAEPQIAILVLVENARQGSLNAVPIAKDVLSWYYEKRIKK